VGVKYAEGALRKVRVDAASRSVLLDAASRSVLFDATSRRVLFVVVEVLVVVIGVVERELVLASIGEERVEVGRAARRIGLFVGVDMFAPFDVVVAVGIAGDCRALAVVVATSGLRGGAVEAGEAGESWERTVRRGGGVDLGVDMLAASRGFNGAGVMPLLGRSLIVDMMVVVAEDAL